MNRFVSRFSDKIRGVLSGFDRLVVRGSLRALARVPGMMSFLWAEQVLLKDFKEYSIGVTKRLKEASLAVGEQLGRPYLYIGKPSASKEAIVDRFLKTHPTDSGLICTLGSVEPCQTYEVHRSRETKHLELKPRSSQCLHLYHYSIDPLFGRIGARIQTWFPFNIQITLNGREWLAHELTSRGIEFERDDNCITWAEDIEAVQRIFDRQLEICWSKAFNRIANSIHPIHDEIFAKFPIPYYWFVHQSEWASDVLFEKPSDLAKLYPSITRHAMQHLSCGDVMRFLGRPISSRFSGEIVTDFKTRPEGVRVKHRADENSVKAYDKAGVALRIETTINEPGRHKVFRTAEGDPDGEPAWRKLRKGIADVHRRAEISQSTNDKYLDALASVSDDTPLQDLLASIVKPTKLGKQRVRGIRPWNADDADLLEAVLNAKYTERGFYNRDIVLALDGKIESDAVKRRRRGSQMSRKIAMLRAHRLVKKVQSTNRYAITALGRQVIAAILAARKASTKKLLDNAA